MERLQVCGIISNEPSEASWQRGGMHSPMSAMYRCSFFTHRIQYKVLYDLGQCPQGRLKEGRYDIHEIQITQLGMVGGATWKPVLTENMDTIL